MRCVFILPYFGKFKNYFELFLKSVKCNDKFDLLLITDNDEMIEYPDNVLVKRMEFMDFKRHIQTKFDFSINLDSPYKLCDYKPAYGYICEEWISEYDYWGHCDCDLLFGDLNKLIKLMENGYDKLFVAGHLTIYKNTKENNRIFMSQLPEKGFLYKKVFSSNDIFAFDEVCYKVNVNDLFMHAGKKIYEEDMSYNTSTKHSMLARVRFDKKSRRWNVEKTRNDQLYWNDGHVYRIRYGLTYKKVEEFLYVHLQMRKMKFDRSILDSNVIRILPDKFKAVNRIPTNYIEFLGNINIYIEYAKIKKACYKLIKHKSSKVVIKWDTPWEYDPYM
ncbi:DUF6625 family protein [Butyrivibrio sp. AC2005]|uniref:DUF6625 family protein n=1 Tax=Butyrivibrio sp. AC2005 TaxID=1280672 RepID=UPI000403A81F|nr:DUF6625 family protein [Butyrivibrio sp. AC2005]